MALPLYPQLKMTLEKFIAQVFEQAARQQLGPFAESPRFIQHEGSAHRYNTMDGKERTTNYHEALVEFRLGPEDIANMEVGDLLKLVVEKGRDLGAQQARYHYQVLDEITTAAGNVVDAKGQQIALELLFETFESLHVAFDDKGNPRMPVVVISPEMEPRFRELAKQAATDEAVRTRMAEIIERKRIEWNEEQDRRKLVD